MEASLPEQAMSGWQSLQESISIKEELPIKRSLYLGMFVPILLTACGSIAAVDPTSTSVPTDTPTPTLTPLPTATPTPLPSATSDVTATAIAKGTESAGAILAELDHLLADTDIPIKRDIWPGNKRSRLLLN